VADPIRPPEIELARKRILSEIARQQKKEEERTEQSEVDRIFNRYAFVANKANVLIRAIEEQAHKFFIPVHEDASRVRAAVTRRSSDSPDGKRISFDLFRDAVDIMIQRKKEMTALAIEEGKDGPTEVFRKKVQILNHQIVNADDSLTETDWRLLISQFFILLIAQQLMQPWSAERWSEIVAASEHAEGSEIVIAAHFIEGILMQMLIQAVAEELLEQWLDDATLVELPRGMKGKDLIQAAKAQSLELTKPQRLAMAYVGQDDYEVILNYSFEYIAKTNEPGYEMWLGYVQGTTIRLEAQSMWARAPLYSVSHSLHIKSAPYVEESSNVGIGTRLVSKFARDPSADLDVSIARTLVPMSRDHQAVLDKHHSTLSDGLDKIAQSLSAEWVQEAACCLARFLSKLDKDKLLKLRAIIKVLTSHYTNALSLKVNGILGDLSGFSLSSVIAEELIYQVERFFDRVLAHVLGLFSDDIIILFCCPLIREMVESVMQVFTEVESAIVDALRQFEASIHIAGVSFPKIWFGVADRRYAQKLILVIDEVLKILETIERCGDPIDRELVDSRLASSIKSMPRLPTIELESNDQEKYFSETVELKTEDGRTIAEVGAKLGAVDFDFSGVQKALAQVGEVGQDVSQRLQDGDIFQEDADRIREKSLCYRIYSDLDAQRAADEF